MQTETQFNPHHPWCVAQFSSIRPQILQRLPTETKAEAQAWALRRLQPTGNYGVVFDPPHSVANE